MSSDNLFAAAGIRGAQALCSALVETVFAVVLILWDIGLFVYNLIAEPLEEGKVVPQGHPGANGVWPEFIPPKDTDSRCSCPALNAMANLGVS